MARSRGYVQANQSVLEEAEEEEVDNTSVFALQNSPRQRAQRELTPQPTYPALATNVLRPNIQEEDRKHVRPDNSDSSDDEVPQSLMIEASSPKPRRQSSKSKEKARAKGISRPFTRPSLSAGGESTRPILPTTTQDVKAAYTSPPKQAEIGLPDQFQHVYSGPPQPKQMRGLDAYERALWNWVNVYNLDAFLQEVYHYYQGKGIYCIALSRGLNLMSVQSLFLLLRVRLTHFP
jgi:autophagy-related protein 9